MRSIKIFIRIASVALVLSLLVLITSCGKTQNNGDETAVYLHGGGTTGKSKTICLSSNNLNALKSMQKMMKFSILVCKIVSKFYLKIVIYFFIGCLMTVLSLLTSHFLGSLKYIS